MTWLIINWTKYLKIPAKFELRYPAVSAIPIPTMASYTTSFSIAGSPDSNQRGSGASLRALCLAAITEPCLHVFVGNPQCWLSPFRAVSCHVILFLTLLGPMWLHIMLLPFKNQKRTKKTLSQVNFPEVHFKPSPPHVSIWLSSLCWENSNWSKRMISISLFLNSKCLLRIFKHSPPLLSLRRMDSPCCQNQSLHMCSFIHSSL